MMAVHRVPPQMMGIMPSNFGGFGGVEKAAKVFFNNEIKCLQCRFVEINEWVSSDIIKFNKAPLF